MAMMMFFFVEVDGAKKDLTTVFFVLIISHA
jgi:hypothetical protein